MKNILLASASILLFANMLFAQTIVPVTPGLPDALFNAAATAQAGDILQLASGGIYPNSAPVAPLVPVTIRTAPGFTRKATCVFLPGATGTYNGNMFTVAASITVQNVIFDMILSGTRGWGNTLFARNHLPTSVIKMYGVEVYHFGFLQTARDLDSLIVKDCFFAGNIRNGGEWGNSFNFGSSQVNYVEMRNNTTMFTIFGPVHLNGWGNYNLRTNGKVIIDHNTIVNVGGDHGPTMMATRTANYVLTNNLLINPTFRPLEFFSDKYIDFPQNEDTLGANSKYISHLGPKGMWVVSLEMVDTANTDLTMEANNIVWTPDVMKVWTDRGLQKAFIVSNETKSKVKDLAKAYFEEQVAFTKAPANPIAQISIIADTAKLGNADPVGFRGKTPFKGAIWYDVNVNHLYDFKTKDSVNMAYPTTLKSYTAAVKSAGVGGSGYPLGDLNWFPSLKPSWEQGINLTGVEELAPIPSAYELGQNYPNPFNPTTNINFSIQQSGFVTLKVFSILGQEVATLINKNMEPGKYSVDFDASQLRSGVYMYQMTAGTYTSSKKMMLLK